MLVKKIVLYKLEENQNCQNILYSLLIYSSDINVILEISHQDYRYFNIPFMNINVSFTVKVDRFKSEF